MIAAYFLNSGIEKAKGKRLLKVELVLAPKQRGCDRDNYAKVLLDALTHCGAIKDDNQIWLDFQSIQFRRGKQSDTIITLEDIE